MKAYQIILFGRVQGVGFRYYVYNIAKEMGLRGFVKNRPDRTVYIEVAAPDQKTFEDFLEKIKKGPARAEVTKVVVNEIPDVYDKRFVIR